MKPTLRTYELLFSLFGNVNVPYEEGNVLSHVDVSKRISIIEMDMFNNGIQHSFVSMKNLIRAFGSEGMIEEMLRYLNIAENILWNINPYQKSDLYSIALHALVDAKETHRAVMIFKIMRSCNLPTDISIYNTMIECCKWLSCFKSASALLSLMLRDGFNPTVVTFTPLLKEHELYNTAIEALLVLSMRMISEDVSILSEKRIAFEDLILSEEPDAELRIIRAFQAGEEFLATALLNLRWCATMGATISWSPEESLWARRLASSYDANKRPYINPSDVPKSW
ncbi:pentatricopeptide repeat-containing protein At1g76280-like [Miscanthus floridulus]|uniref:pentatricopeptide repeat-containing protein At1g76280-like n=1 Tax=Miscanthus floridulus TaxID=154761 RepID=UPI003459CB94